MGDVENGVKIGVDHLRPEFVAHFVEELVGRNAGVVDQHLNGSQISDDTGDTFLAGVIIRDIPLVGLHRGFGFQ